MLRCAAKFSHAREVSVLSDLPLGLQVPEQKAFSGVGGHAFDDKARVFAWGKKFARRRAPGLMEGKPKLSHPGGEGSPSDPRRYASVLRPHTPVPKASQQIAQTDPFFLR